MLFTLLLSVAALANCQWSSAETMGTFSGKTLPEASGVTSDGKDLFFINDTEGDGSIYSFSLSGGLQKISVPWSPKNLEAISYGKCGKGFCFYLADIGDNDLDRESVTVLAVEEKTRKVWSEWNFTYEDGPKNVEAFFVDDAGVFYFLSKSEKKSAGEATVYSLSPQEQKAGVARKIAATKLDAPVTDMALSPNRQNVAILTTKGGFELPFADFRAGDFRRKTALPLETLKKQESITYLGDTSLVWSTEAKKLTDVPILRIRCENP
jgi:hypothetical protein